MAAVDIGFIAEKFIRAAEVDRQNRERVGPAPLRAQQLNYVHDQADKNGWGKSQLARIVKKGRLIQGDWLDANEDPLADERKRFWERMGMTPTAEEMRELDGLYDMLMLVEDDGQRRALLAWARAKAGGKAFRRWCFQVEGIHEETGRRRKDRALARIRAHLVRNDVQNYDNGHSDLLPSGPEIGDVSATVEEDAGRREGLNNWAAADAIIADLPDLRSFDWAAKRNAHRRKMAERKRRAAEKAAA